MKVTITFVASLLACAVVARPTVKDEGDPLPETSRVTAFVIDDNGNPSVECWEISAMSDYQHVKRHDGSVATAHAVSLARNDELEGIDILTWPSLAPIWPPSSGSLGIHAQAADLSKGASLFSVQNGLIILTAQAGSSAQSDDDKVETHIFSLENGDDWFYFEDQSSSDYISLAESAEAADYPFEIGTISATETELLRLRYPRQPKHTVVHKGACKFTGIRTDISDDTPSHLARPGLNVQVHIEEAL